MNHHKPDQVMQEVKESYMQIYNIRSYVLINVNFACRGAEGGDQVGLQLFTLMLRISSLFT